MSSYHPEIKRSIDKARILPTHDTRDKLAKDLIKGLFALSWWLHETDNSDKREGYRLTSWFENKEHTDTYALMVGKPHISNDAYVNAKFFKINTDEQLAIKTAELLVTSDDINNPAATQEIKDKLTAEEVVAALSMTLKIRASMHGSDKKSSVDPLVAVAMWSVPGHIDLIMADQQPQLQPINPDIA